jgi:hypothetical protein
MAGDLENGEDSHTGDNMRSGEGLPSLQPPMSNFYAVIISRPTCEDSYTISLTILHCSAEFSTSAKCIV